MRVRIKEYPRGGWVVESTGFWRFLFGWHFEEVFFGDKAYDRAYEYARKLKNPCTMEVI